MSTNNQKAKNLNTITNIIFVLSMIVIFCLTHSIAQADDRPELLFMGILDAAEANDFWFSIGWDVRAGGGASSWQSGGTGGLGYESSGGGLAMGYINDNDIPDVVFVYLNDWTPDDFRYKIGFDFNINDGSWGSWSGSIQGPNLGHHSAGGGATIGYINDNERPDLVLMGIDDPDGANSFWYYIGWDLNTEGSPAEWSDKISVSGVSSSNEGGGATIGYIDNDPRPDLILMGVDAPSRANNFRYKVGLNLGTDGRTQNWSYVGGNALGFQNDGGGATLGYVNDNGIPDLILMAIDNPSGDNSFWYHVGLDLNTNGQPASWTGVIGPAGIPGWANAGGGAALVYKPLTQPQLVSPVKGSNGKVNVALNEPVTFEVDFADNRFNATLAGAQWWYTSAADPEDRRDFTTTSTGEKQYTFTDVGDYIIYCRVIEEVSGRKSVSRTIAIPVRVWNRPTVATTPPQANIDAGDVSWFNGKYVGVKGQAVRLIADGNTENGDPD